MDSEAWYKNPLRIGAMQWNLGDNALKAPEILKNGGFNTEQLLHIMAAGDNIGLTVFNRTRDGERLSEYMGLCRKQGIKTILYFNAHMMDADTFGQNSGWAQTDMAGRPLEAYRKFILTCVNSSWRNWFMDSVRAALEYGIDGVFLDGPIFGREACGCDACSKLFENKYGHSVKSATGMELLGFKTESIAAFICEVRSVIKSVNAEVILYANSHGLSANITGCDIDAIYPYVDFLGTEGGFMFYGNPNEISIWHGSRNAKYLDEKAKGKPAVIFAAGNSCPWTRYMHTPEESRLLFASAAANGANVWYGIHGPLDMLDTPGGKAAYEFNRFLACNEEYYMETQKLADMAILWSKATINAFPGSIQKTDFVEGEKIDTQYNLGSFLNEFNGFYEIMARNHVQFSIIDDKILEEEDISRFKLLVLPNVCCMGEAEAEKIKAYVKNGGTVLATSGTSFLDRKGKVRSEPVLADLFGITAVGEVMNYNAGCSYIRLSEDKELQEGLSSGLTIGCSTSVKCSYSGDAAIAGVQYVPMDGGYDYFPTDSFPTIITRGFGKGRVIYVSGGLGEAYFKYLPDALKTLGRNLLYLYTEPIIRIENAYESLEVETRIQPDKKRILIHFVNYTGCMQRPINRIIPCSNIKIRLNIKEKVTGVKTLYNKQDISFEQQCGGIGFRLDVAGAYELAVVQME